MKLDLTMFATNKFVSKNEFNKIENQMNKKYESYFKNAKIHELVIFSIGKFEYTTTIEAFQILVSRKLVKADSMIDMVKAKVIFFESNQKDQLYCANNISKKELKDFRDLGQAQYSFCK